MDTAKLVMLLSSARELATKAIQQAQQEGLLKERDYCLAGKMRKLARPWHAPYRVVGLRETDVTIKILPQYGLLQVHKKRVSFKFTRKG